jgi:crotonobetainyl-CoA:carnitine CoA-transferase CaiB-like acyl-CoA transferase
VVTAADAVLDDRALWYWRARGLDLHGLYEDAHGSARPRANWCAITPYGLAGAGPASAAGELLYQASGPLLIRLGAPGRPPIPLRGPQAQVGAAWHAAMFVTAAHAGGGPGRLLDVSIQECQYMHSELGIPNWHFNGTELSRSRFTRATNPNVFETLDGYVHMLFHDREWPRVAQMIGRPDLAHDRRFMARYERTRHLDELDALLTPWFLSQTSEEAVAAAQAVGMPMAVTCTPAQVLEDPQLSFRGAFEHLPLADSTIAFPLGVGALHGTELPRRRDKAQVGPPLDVAALPERQPRPPTVASAPPSRPLSGVRVVDLTNTWAAPRAATLLAELGADVIKLEGIEWMDMLRGFTEPPPVDASYPRNDPGDRPWDRYLMWLGLGRGKRSVALELTRPQGRALLDALIATADVVLTNMSASTRAKHRLDFTSLCTVNPRIIFATLSGYGDEGPRSSWRLFGDGQASMAGLFTGSGYPDSEPISFGAYGDPVNGVALAFHVCAALAERQRTGRAIYVDVSAVESCLTYNALALIEAQIGEFSDAPAGLDSRGRWPHGIYPCLGEDRWLAVSCVDDAERSALTKGLRALEAVPPAVPTEADFEALLTRVCAQHEPEKVEQLLRLHGAPCQKVMRGRDIDADPILTSRGFIAWLWRDDLGGYPQYSPMWLVNGERPPVRFAARRFGEDNRDVLIGLLGLPPGELACLEREGVVGDRPLAGAELGVRPPATAPATAVEGGGE